MTITQDITATLVAVVGSTGKQGGSVNKTLADSMKRQFWEMYNYVAEFGCEDLSML